MKTSKFMTSLFTASALLLASTFANAVVLNITPAEQTVFLGDSVSVDISISGLTDANALGDFDFDFLFDSSILGLSSITFGDQLGFSDQGSSSGSGWANINEISWEPAADLVANQANSFSLATLSFSTLSVGTSTIALDTLWSIGDQNGEWLDWEINNALVNVIEESVSVPEPSSLMLLGFGLLGLGLSRRRSL